MSKTTTHDGAQSETGAAKPETNVVESSAAETVALTAYQGGPAVVRELRALTLPSGVSRVYIGGLPKQFVPNSQTIVSVSGNGKFKVGKRSLRPANLSTQALLQESVGKRIVFIDDSGDEEHATEGVLEHIVDGRVAVLRTTTENQSGRGRGKKGDHEGVLVVPITQKFRLKDGIPAGLSDLSILVMEPEVEIAGDFGVKMLYEAGGINWTPWYEIFYDRKAAKLARFACYVDLTNESGTTFDTADIKLIAGVNQSDAANRMTRKNAVRAFAAAAPMMEAAGGGAPQADFSMDQATAEDVGDQKMYKLNDPVTLENGVPNSPTLVLSTDVPVEHEYHAYVGGYTASTSDNHADLPKGPVNVKLRLLNTAASNLGIDLPAGDVRVFEPDSAGDLQKTDSSRVAAHVSKGEGFSLDLRNPARDLKVTREQIELKEDPKPVEDEEASDAGAAEGHLPIHPTAMAMSPAVTEAQPAETDGAGKKKAKPRYAEEEREVTVLNFRDHTVEVVVHEQVPTDAEFLSKSHDFAKFNASAGRGVYRVTVPGKSKDTAGATKIRYRIKYRIS